MKILFYLRCARWIWKHKNERNNRQKFRRMDREISSQMQRVRGITARR